MRITIPCGARNATGLATAAPLIPLRLHRFQTEPGLVGKLAPRDALRDLWHLKAQKRFDFAIAIVWAPVRVDLEFKDHHLFVLDALGGAPQELEHGTAAGLGRLVPRQTRLLASLAQQGLGRILSGTHAPADEGIEEPGIDGLGPAATGNPDRPVGSVSDQLRGLASKSKEAKGRSLERKQSLARAWDRHIKELITPTGQCALRQGGARDGSEAAWIRSHHETRAHGFKAGPRRPDRGNSAIACGRLPVWTILPARLVILRAPKRHQFALDPADRHHARGQVDRKGHKTRRAEPLWVHTLFFLAGALFDLARNEPLLRNRKYVVDQPVEHQACGKEEKHG
jgi:hypothetical protein